MAKRKRKTTTKFRLRHPREVGKFYRICDSSGGHPAMVYYSDVINDIYYVQRFSTKPRKDRIKLKHSINLSGNNDEWLVKKPELVGYDNLQYYQEYENYRIHEDDTSTVTRYQKFDLKMK